MDNTVNSFQELLKLPDNAAYYFYGERSYTTGWKMHLFLNSAADKYPSLHNETVEKVAKFLMDKNLEHKFRNGCDGANTFCIYVGGRDECEQLAKELNAEFGPEFKKLSPEGNGFKGSDENLLNSPNIGMRFDGANANLTNSVFLRYGEGGIPTFLNRISLASAVLGRKIPAEDEKKLKKTACHLILAKYCAEKYLGKNYAEKPWDQKIFNDVSMFSADEIQKFTKTCIALYNPKQYIKQTSLADSEYEIDVAQKMKPQNPYTQMAENIAKKFRTKTM